MSSGLFYSWYFVCYINSYLLMLVPYSRWLKVRWWFNQILSIDLVGSFLFWIPKLSFLNFLVRYLPIERRRERRTVQNYRPSIALIRFPFWTWKVFRLFRHPTKTSTDGRQRRNNQISLSRFLLVLFDVGLSISTKFYTDSTKVVGLSTIALNASKATRFRIAILGHNRSETLKKMI